VSRLCYSSFACGANLAFDNFSEETWMRGIAHARRCSSEESDYSGPPHQRDEIIMGGFSDSLNKSHLAAHPEAELLFLRLPSRPMNRRRRRPMSKPVQISQHERGLFMADAGELSGRWKTPGKTLAPLPILPKFITPITHVNSRQPSKAFVGTSGACCNRLQCAESDHRAFANGES